MKLDRLIDLVMDIISRKCFALFEGPDPKIRSFLVYQSPAIYQKPSMMVFCSFEGVLTRP